MMFFCNGNLGDLCTGFSGDSRYGYDSLGWCGPRAHVNIKSCTMPTALGLFQICFFACMLAKDEHGERI